MCSRNFQSDETLDPNGIRDRNLIYFHEVAKGGHFAAWEQPELFAVELRAATASLR